jgi:hypothetical protein
MPILGIMASAMSANLWQPQGAYDALSTVTVPSGGVASVTFAAIPTGYKHLQLRWIARTNRAATNGDFMVMRFNGISTSASYYGQHTLYGNGTSAVAGADGTHTGIYIERTSSANMTANIFGVGIIDILDYQDTNKNKVIRAFAGLEANSGDTTSNVRLASGMLLSAPAITSISFIPGVGTSFAEHSQLTLYGVK